MNSTTIVSADHYEPKQVMTQIKQIQDLMSQAMRDNEHYGVIPGTKKPTLLKPGAEKLGLMFRLAPEFQITKSELNNNHREYEVVCTLKHIVTGQVWGQGVGSCSTMEGRYRFRTGEVEITGKPVPQDYWTNRDQELIGGKGFSTKKVDGKWEIVKQGEKIEHDNPADYYNTVLKMAKKRAHVDAMITATAASDIFTQDMEDIQENMKVYEDLPEDKKVEQKKDEKTYSWIKGTELDIILDSIDADHVDVFEKRIDYANETIKLKDGTIKKLGSNQIKKVRELIAKLKGELPLE